MVDINKIKPTIEKIEELYDNSTDTDHKIYYSKLALIELCGWLEETIDKLCSDYVNNNCSITYVDLFKKTAIDSTYGFHYDSHFRQMLLKLVGIKKLEQIENNLSTEIPILKSQLGTLWSRRKVAAHTSIEGVTLNFFAPSILIGSYLSSLSAILLRVQAEINS